MQACAVKPAVPPAGQVHRQVDMTAQGPEAGVVEMPDRTHVAGHGPDRQVLVAAGGGLGGCPLDEEPPDAPAAERAGDDDRLDLTAGPAVKQARETDHPATGLRHPGRHPLRQGEVAIEPAAGIIAPDGGVFVDPPVMLGQFRPQQTAGCVVSRRVAADRNAGHGRRARHLAVAHRDRLPDLRRAGDPITACRTRTASCPGHRAVYCPTGLAWAVGAG